MCVKICFENIQAKVQADTRIQDLALENQRLAQQNQQLFALLSKCTCQTFPHSISHNLPIVANPKPVRLQERPPLSRESSVEADSGIAIASTPPSPAKTTVSLISPPKDEGEIELTVTAYNSILCPKVDSVLITSDSNDFEGSGSPLDLSQNSRSVQDLSQASEDVLDLRKQ